MMRKCTTLLHIVVCFLVWAADSRRPVEIVPSPGFLSRKEHFVAACAAIDGFFNSVCLVDLGLATLNETKIDAELTNVNERVGTTLDFRIVSLLRMLYLDKETKSIPEDLKQRIKEAILGFRYSFTDPPTIPDTNIFWTENHLILYRTCELLAGQLLLDEVFTVSGLTGADHAARALSSLVDWLNKKGTLGLAEWHSNPYYTIDIAALVNLVDFAMVPEISIKAAMVLDLIAFDMANNYYKGLYATSMGRTEDVRRVTTTPRLSEQVTNSAYLMLGLEEMFESGLSDMGSIAIATSRKYVPPPILEKVARAARESHEHKERKSISVDQGDLYGIDNDPNNINDMMFWWAMNGIVAGPLVNATLTLIEQFDIDPVLIVTDAQFINILKLGAANNGVSISEYCSTTAEYLVRGTALETANIYTYRTSQYQLSGAQDRSNKGWTSLQEHAWQATLDISTYIFTNSPSQLSQEFIGGWMPRVTLYKNVGIIQYDKDSGDPFLNSILNIIGVVDFLHAYFPRSQFDHWIEVESVNGTYLFGEKGEGYVSLFSQVDGVWESDFEWRVPGQKNVFVLELGSQEENGPFEQFQADIIASNLEIKPSIERGYMVSYDSPSLGFVEVAWEGPMVVGGKAVNLGPYSRYDNVFSQQEFGTPLTEIRYECELLALDFSLGERLYLQDDDSQCPMEPETPAPTGSASGDESCFSGDSKVNVELKGPTKMSDLSIGDFVEVADNTFEPVYSFGHKNSEAISEFLSIATEGNQLPLEISKDHMVSIGGGRYAPASTIRRGDKLVTSTSDVVVVKTIQTVFRKGVYAPFTASGSIIVNDIVVSNYVAFKGKEHIHIGGMKTPFSYQWLAHIFNSVHRVAFKMGVTGESYTKNGISQWVVVPYETTTWMLEQHFVVALALLFPAICIFGSLAYAEISMNRPVTAIPIYCIVGVMIVLAVRHSVGLRLTKKVWH